MMSMNFMYHLVSLSPWPLICSCSLMFMMLGILKFFYLMNLDLMMVSNLNILLVVFQWWRDVMRESMYQGFHTIKVKMGLRMGMLLFILSELMFFVSFFWSYFHMFLSPSLMMGSKCPSYGLETFNPYNIPLLNTLILLTSGMSITWCHHNLMNNKLKVSIISIYITFMLGMIFTIFQYMEYKESYFSISDSMFGSIFFLGTGFHGMHVLIGSFFILINLIYIEGEQFSSYNMLSFECASWYWHFVDIIWLFLYMFFYWMY